MSDTSVKFCERLRGWRKAHNWRQKEACEVLKVDIDMYRKWEQDVCAPHESPSMAEILCRMEASK